jgi:hypothetical protein
MSAACSTVDGCRSSRVCRARTLVCYKRRRLHSALDEIAECPCYLGVTVAGRVLVPQRRGAGRVTHPVHELSNACPRRRCECVRCVPKVLEAETVWSVDACARPYPTALRNEGIVKRNAQRNSRSRSLNPWGPWHDDDVTRARTPAR